MTDGGPGHWVLCEVTCSGDGRSGVGVAIDDAMGWKGGRKVGVNQVGKGGARRAFL